LPYLAALHRKCCLDGRYDLSMTKAELHEQIDSMTDEEAAEAKLIFAPDWPSKGDFHRGDPQADWDHADESRGFRPALRIAAHRRRGIGVHERGYGSAL